MWYYLSLQTMNEVVIFLTFDSEGDGGLCKIPATRRGVN